MQFKSSLLLAAVGSSIIFADATAVGIGRPVSNLVLGSLLDISISVRLEDGEALETECLTAQVQIGERRVPSYDLHFSIESGRDPQERLVRLSAPARVDEPLVNVTLAAGCQGRVSRKFTVLADPPTSYALPSAADPALVSNPAPLAAARAGDSALPLPRIMSSNGVLIIPPASGLPTFVDPEPVNAAPAAAASRAAAEPRQAVATAPTTAPRIHASKSAAHSASAVRAVAKTTAPVSRPSRVARNTARPNAASSTDGRARLQLDVVEAVRNPGLAAAASAAAASAAADAAALVAALNAASAAQASASVAQARVMLLEQQVQRLAAESAAQREEAQKAREKAQGSDEIGWLAPILGLILALVAALALWLGLRLRSRIHAEDERWWSEEAVDAARARAAGAVPLADPVASMQQDFGASADQPESGLGALSAPAKFMPSSEVSLGSLQSREVSVEELIDLEQQAEFFVVLGQDDAAIDLLVSHVRGSGGTSPLPYLKLLEIYRRRSDRESYERTRSRFNQRFNAYAPDWDSDLQHGRALDAYPQVMERLQHSWPRPLDAMAELGALLFRKDGGELFELPAYREVLLLFSLARELLDNQDTRIPDVDVLLPIGESHFETTGTKPHLLEQLAGDSIFATGAAFDRPTRSVDLDMAFDALPSQNPTRPAPLDELGNDDSQFSGLIDLSDLDERR
jgi:hypothetical protein